KVNSLIITPAGPRIGLCSNLTLTGPVALYGSATRSRAGSGAGAASITGPLVDSSMGSLRTNPSLIAGLFIDPPGLAVRCSDVQLLRQDFLTDAGFFAPDTFPTHAHLTVTSVGLQRRLTRCADQRV